MNFRRWSVALAGVTLVASAACSSGSSDATSESSTSTSVTTVTSTTTTTPSIDAQALADSAVLTAADAPDGWALNTDDLSSDPDTSTCTGVEDLVDPEIDPSASGRAGSKFDDGSGGLVTVQINVYADEAAAAAKVDRFGSPAYQTCLRGMVESLGTEEGFTVQVSAMDGLPVAIGDHAVGVRTTSRLTDTATGTGIDLHQDEIVVRVGPAVAMFSFSSPLQLPEAEQHLFIDPVVERLQQGLAT